MKTPPNGPVLSVILVTEEAGGLRRILDRLAAQNRAADCEVLIAAADPAAVEVSAVHAGAFHALRILPADTTTSARARAIAVASARAPYVALAEDHCFPLGNDWADRLIAGLDAGHAAVGPVMRNANPATRTSRANLAVEYAQWIVPADPPETDALPGHNSAYRRDVLTEYGDRLADMLEAEWVMHANLRRQGCTLLHDRGITVAHLNYSRVRRSVRLQYLAGRMFAASRAAEWSTARRLIYAAAAPAIPALRTLRTLRQLARAGEPPAAIADVLPMIALLCLASGLGEGLGYALGDGGRRPALAQLEYRRWRNLRPDETHLAL